VASRDVVEILNAALCELGGLIRFPGESGCLRLLEERFASDECRQSQIITRSAQGLNDIDEDSEDSEATKKKPLDTPLQFQQSAASTEPIKRIHLRDRVILVVR
jgi:hypothetical protein